MDGERVTMLFLGCLPLFDPFRRRTDQPRIETGFVGATFQLRQ